MLSGPLFEPGESEQYRSVGGREGAHYNVYAVKSGYGMRVLRETFEGGEADEMNFVLFSTSGVHGSYSTIEDAEKHLLAPDPEDPCGQVTFLIVQPRLVCTRYGNCTPENADDIAFLKKLRESSWRVVAQIGRPEEKPGT